MNIETIVVDQKRKWDAKTGRNPLNYDLSLHPRRERLCTT